MANTNNTIDMSNEKDRSIREYVVFDPNALHTSIMRPEVTTTQFEFKPIMFQMLQIVGKFLGANTNDPHIHLQ